MYSPPLDTQIRSLTPIPSGSTREVEMRAASIWCVELIRREIERRHPDAKAMFQPSPPAEDADPNGSAEELEANRDEHKKCTTQKRWKNKSVDERGTPGVNAILIDFFLYDTMKELEGKSEESIPHHRTRSIWY